MSRRSLLGRIVKRALDVGVAGPVLVASSPVLAGVALAIYLDIGRPILFRQRRPGLHAKPFTLLKFRTMRDTRGPDGQLLSDEERLSPVGSWVRKLSLDELPQLVNVLKGEMSLVGPRPLLMDYLERYSPTQARRHEVKPGVTGWAQVNGRNTISWEEKFELDVYYVEHQTLRLDLEILVKTFLHVVRSEGISAVGHATMPVFMGSAESTPAPRGVVRRSA